MDRRTSPLVVLMPVYRDWEAVRLLAPRLEAALSKAGMTARVLLVDDGSPEARPPTLGSLSGGALTQATILRLRRNLGHQRAIAVGLAHLDAEHPGCTVVVMDSDGEDDPDDVPRLVRHLQDRTPGRIVFAERRRRSESWGFRIGYSGYRILHRLLVGFGVQVGNFSVIPPERLHQLTVVPELWNHYAAAVFKARVPHATIPTSRAKRLAGAPTMNYPALVAHGLSALSVHGEIAGTRLLMASLTLAACVLTALTALAGIAVATDWVIPTWAWLGVAVQVVLLIVLGLSGGTAAMVILNSRSGSWFLPERDFRRFVDRVEPLSLDAAEA